MSIPSIQLKDKIIPPEALKAIPQEAALFYQFIPFAKEDGLLKIAMIDPSDITAREALKFIAQNHNFKTEIYQADKVEFQNAFKQYADLEGEVDIALKTWEQEAVAEQEQAQDTTQKVAHLAQEAPITKMVGVILRHAVEGKASDIHIEAAEKDSRVRFRLDGDLHTSLALPKKIHAAVISRIKILSNLKLDEQRKPQDGRFRLKVGQKNIDFRVSTMPTVNGEKVVLRLLDTSLGLRELEEIGLHGKALEKVNASTKKPHGMILVTGPTGSGKSTTLYAILKILNQEAVNIITLEDPVEYWITGVNQSQIKPEIGYTFASGLRSILRQDPDVIMVGEIRDQETAELAVHAALTGHVVLSTLHTNDAVGAIPRLIDMGIEPFLLPASLNLVIAQRLIRKIGKIAEWQKAAPDIAKMIQQETGKQGIIKLPKAKELKGRVGIFEVLSMTTGLEKVIVDNLTDDALRKEAEHQNMTTMKQDGIIKVLKGIATLEEVLKAVEE